MSKAQHSSIGKIFTTSSSEEQNVTMQQYLQITTQSLTLSPYLDLMMSFYLSSQLNNKIQSVTENQLWFH